MFIAVGRHARSSRWILAISAVKDHMLVETLACNHPAIWRAPWRKLVSRSSDDVPCPGSFMFPTTSLNRPRWLLTTCSISLQKSPWPRNILPTSTRVRIVSSCQFCAHTLDGLILMMSTRTHTVCAQTHCESDPFSRKSIAGLLTLHKLLQKTPQQYNTLTSNFARSAPHERNVDRTRSKT